MFAIGIVRGHNTYGRYEQEPRLRASVAALRKFEQVRHDLELALERRHCALEVDWPGIVDNVRNIGCDTPVCLLREAQTWKGRIRLENFDLWYQSKRDVSTFRFAFDKLT